MLFEEEVTLGDQYTALEQITVYPNPTQNVLNIISSSPIDRVTVYDVRGREVLRESFNQQGTYQIDMSALETAMYFVRIDTQDGSISKRIIKQ